MELSSPAIGAIGVIIGAVLTGGFALISHHLAYKRESERWAADQRRKDAEWFRERLLDAYGECIYRLTAIAFSGGSPGQVPDHIGEALRYLALLGSYSSDTATMIEFRNCALQLAPLKDHQGLMSNADSILIRQR